MTICLDRLGGFITDSCYDGMPAEVERAYRRGFTHGLAEAIEALKSDEEIGWGDLYSWLMGPVWAWRWSEEARAWRADDLVNPTLSPDFTA